MTELRDSCRELREATAAWLVQRRADERFLRFAGHFDAIETVVGELLDRLVCELAAIDPATGSGVVYDRCRKLEEGLLVVRRLLRWYTERYDQRLVEPTGSLLAAADEVVRSCWLEPFAATRAPAPAGPLVFVDPRWGACANLRTSVPVDLRGPADGDLRDLLKQLPVPTIALPPACQAGGWWLVLAAHETGHHVMHDVAGAADAARDALAAAVAVARPGLVGDWLRWTAEVFADAYATVMIGGAAAWAVGELEHGPPARLARIPESTDRYPPPAVRLALIGELTRELRLGDWPENSSGVGGWLAAQPATEVPIVAREVISEHLAVVPEVAAALAGLPLGGRLTQAAWFASDGRVDAWAGRLRDGDPRLYPAENRPAARLALAAGVSAYRGLSVSGPASVLAELHRNLVAALRRCGPPGVLAPAGSVRELGDVTLRFGDRLFGRAATP